MLVLLVKGVTVRGVSFKKNNSKGKHGHVSLFLHSLSSSPTFVTFLPLLSSLFPACC